MKWGINDHDLFLWLYKGSQTWTKKPRKKPADLLELISQPYFSKKNFALFTTYINLVNSSTRASSWHVGAQGQLVIRGRPGQANNLAPIQRYCLKSSVLEQGWRTFSRKCDQIADNFSGNYFQCENPGLHVPYFPLIQWRHRAPCRLARRTALRLAHPLFRPCLELNLNCFCYIWSGSHSTLLRCILVHSAASVFVNAY